MDELSRQQEMAADELASQYRSVEEISRDYNGPFGSLPHLHVLAHDHLETGASFHHVIDEDGVLRARWAA